jgi:VanZ family protein
MTGFSLPRFIPAIVWWLFSLVLLTLPGSRFPKYPWLATIHADKWIHIFLFGMLCLLFCFPFRNSDHSRSLKQQWFFRILLLVIAYGIIMEFVQDAWVVNRSFELADIAADTAGALLGWGWSRKKFS